MQTSREQETNMYISFQTKAEKFRNLGTVTACCANSKVIAYICITIERFQHVFGGGITETCGYEANATTVYQGILLRLTYQE